MRNEHLRGASKLTCFPYGEPSDVWTRQFTLRLNGIGVATYVGTSTSTQVEPARPNQIRYVSDDRLSQVTSSSHPTPCP